MLGIGLGLTTRRRTGAAAPPFTPTDIANLKWWLKADSLALADGAAVSSWADSGSGGFNGTQPTGGFQPTKQTVGGAAVVRFDGVDDRLEQVNLAYPWGSATTMFIVMRSSDPDFCVYGSQQSGGNGVLYCCGSLMSAPGYFGMQKIGIGQGVSVANFDTALRVYTVQDDLTNYANYQNGTALPMLSNVNGAAVNSGFVWHIGARNVPTPDNFMAGDIAEMILYSRSLTAAERAQVHAYLAAKYAIATSEFKPTDVTGLVRWYRADSLNLAEGALVTTVVDGMAVANATQATGAKQPTNRLGVRNGRTVMRFDGVDDALGFTSAGGTQTSIFLVAKVTTGTDDYLFGGSAGNGSPGVLSGYDPGGGRQGMEAYHNTAAGPNRATLVASTAVAWKVVGYTLNDAGGAGSFRGYANGVEMFSNVIGDPLAPNGFRFFGAADINGTGGAGTDIAEVLVYNRAVTQAEALQIMAYLNSPARWAVY